MHLHEPRPSRTSIATITAARYTTAAVYAAAAHRPAPFSVAREAEHDLRILAQRLRAEERRAHAAQPHVHPAEAKVVAIEARAGAAQRHNKHAREARRSGMSAAACEETLALA